MLPAGWIVTWHTRERFYHTRIAPVHNPTVLGESFPTWPIDVVTIKSLLSNHASVGGSGESDAVEVLGADCILSRANDRFRIEISGRKTLSNQNSSQSWDATDNCTDPNELEALFCTPTLP